MNKWISREGIIKHPDGYVAYATIWFDSNEVVAIEPHCAGLYGTGEFHYYNRIMGEEIQDYSVELYEDQ